MSMHRSLEIMYLRCDHCGEEWDSGTDRQHTTEGVDAARRIGWAWLGLDVNLCPQCSRTLESGRRAEYVRAVETEVKRREDVARTVRYWSPPSRAVRIIFEAESTYRESPGKALALYEEAYGIVMREAPVVADCEGGKTSGVSEIIDKLTLCLQKLGRSSEIPPLVEAWFTFFTDEKSSSSGIRILKRAERARRKTKP